MRWLVLLGAVSIAGCGLTLDYGPPSPDSSTNGTLDSSIVRVDAGVDGGARDTSVPRDGRPGIDTGDPLGDAMATNDGGIVTTLDADVPLDAVSLPDADLDDAATLDAALVDAAMDDAAAVDASVLDAALIDAASTDAGSDAATTLDATTRDASMVVCMGVHPIIGPPRTCNPGSCLCVGTDTCYTVDTVASCCTGTFVCASPTSDCMPTHPIVGPPRTCASGGCYCSNPDACFPTDRASRCCSVGVVCVP